MAASRILVVCTGNICRSPMAEIVLQALDSQLVVDSAGTSGWHEGDPIDPRARDALAARGYDGAHHRARQLEALWLAQRDLVLVADRGHLRAVRRLAADVPGAAPIRLLGEFAGQPDAPDVPDPYYGEAQDFARCLTLIEECCRSLVQSLRGGWQA